MKKTAILLSRQSLRPCGATPWIRQTIKAIQWVKVHDFTLVSSLGMPAWEFITATGSICGVKQEIVVPVSTIDEFNNLKRKYIGDFNLDKKRSRLIPLVTNTSCDKKEKMSLRDRYIIKTANLLIPVSLRPKGNMQKLMSEVQCKGKSVLRDFECGYDKKTEPLKYEINPHHINTELDRISRPYLIHWTRAANSAWPDERQIDYWQSIISSKEYPRRALDTLKHILATNNIIASSRHIPGNIPTVSFSELSPRAVIPLMRWRARYCQMSFEPYGIGIEKDYALLMGVRPVRYYNNATDQKPEISNQWQWQSQGQRTDWRQEKEYRYLGNFDFSQIPKNKMILFCRFPSEAEKLQKDTVIRCISIEK